MKNEEFKEINIQNRTCYYVDDNYFDFDDILINKKT